MKRFAIFCFLLFTFYSSKLVAQIQMDIKKMIISQLIKNSNTKILTNGKDTTSISILTLDNPDLPCIEVNIQMKNISKDNILLCVNQGILYMSYILKDELYKEEMSFSVENSRGEMVYKDTVILKPQDFVCVKSETFLGSHHPIRFHFSKKEDRALDIMQILPTLKFHYEDTCGTNIIHKNVLKVIIKDRPSNATEFEVPIGYSIIPTTLVKEMSP